MKTLNEVFSPLSASRRYEVWFLRLGMTNGSGAWWFRYLLMNPGRAGCPGDLRGMPVQVWATCFPREGKPQSLIQGFPLAELELSGRGQSPFHFQIEKNAINENSCRGEMEAQGHKIHWDLKYQSSFRTTMSNMSWIGFSRSPHSDARFTGVITLDGKRFQGDDLGIGVQGHNCGYRHRNFWTWGHTYFPRPNGRASTFEALVYEMPFGLFFHKAVLWHEGKEHVFRDLQETCRDNQNGQWGFRCSTRDGLRVEAAFDGRGPSMHRLPYVKTNCSGGFEVANNSLAKATVILQPRTGPAEKLETTIGAALEMAGG